MRAVVRDGALDCERTTPLRIRWRQLYKLAQYHRLVPAVVRHCNQRAGTGQILIDDLEALNQQCEKDVARTQRMVAQAVPVLGDVSRAVPLLLAKGSHL